LRSIATFRITSDAPLSFRTPGAWLSVMATPTTVRVPWLRTPAEEQDPVDVAPEILIAASFSFAPGETLNTELHSSVTQPSVTWVPSWIVSPDWATETAWLIVRHGAAAVQGAESLPLVFT
jgi:hypothetical protein